MAELKRLHNIALLEELDFMGTVNFIYNRSNYSYDEIFDYLRGEGR